MAYSLLWELDFGKNMPRSIKPNEILPVWYTTDFHPFTGEMTYTNQGIKLNNRGLINNDGYCDWDLRIFGVTSDPGFSFECWIYLITPIIGTYYLNYLYWITPNPAYFYFYITSSAIVASLNKSNSINPTTATINTALSLNKWYHLYVTYVRSTSSTGRVAIALDGASWVDGNDDTNTAYATSNYISDNTLIGYSTSPNQIIMSNAKRWDEHRYTKLVNFTPDPRTAPNLSLFTLNVPQRTLPNTIPYYAPYLRGKPYGQ